MSALKRITVFVMHADDETDYNWVCDWFQRWESTGKLNVVNHSSGGWEHCFDIEATQEVIDEVPESYLCASEWATPELFKKKK